MNIINGFKRIIVPDDVNLYFVGDLHGDYKSFKLGIDDLGIDINNDYIISVGDIIDRGKNNLKLFFDFFHKPNYHMVCGNHESMLIDGLTDTQWRHCWLQNGGNTTLEEAGDSGIKFMADIFMGLPLILEVHHRGKIFGVVHGGIPASEQFLVWNNIIDRIKYDYDYCFKCLWERDGISYATEHMMDNESTLTLFPVIDGIDYLISGHTGHDCPVQYNNRIWIDTGFYTGITFAYYADGKMNYNIAGDYNG